MNDPNGLQWRYDASAGRGGIAYEMFFQMAPGPDQQDICVGSEGKGSHVWGHARSSDLVRWKRLPDSGMCGSTGAGVTLPPGFKGPNGETWLSANIASAPSMPSRSNPGPRGLKLWTSNDTDLIKYEEYLPPGTRALNDSGTNTACVICPGPTKPGDPSNPPNWTRAADIGDSYVWSDPAWNVPVDPAKNETRTFYVLSGEGRCPYPTSTSTSTPTDDDDDDPPPPPPIWCGWAAGREPQALLFRSKNLVDWQFVSEFYNGTQDQYTAVMTPETFRFPGGEQVLIWLGRDNTHWVTGHAVWERGGGGDDDDDTTNYEGNHHHQDDQPRFVEASLGGNPSFGPEDVGGGTHCGQSLWDANGRRVQFMWLGLDVDGAPYTGSQSLPREIVLAPPGTGVVGLLFRPLDAEMASLHTSKAGQASTLRLRPGGPGRVVYPPDGLHAHIKATIRPATANVTIVVRADSSAISVSEGAAAEAVPAVPAALARSGSGGSSGSEVSVGSAVVDVGGGQVGLNGRRATINSSINGDDSTVLEIFVDGPITEVFANGGQRSLTAGGRATFVAGTDIVVTAGAGPPAVVDLVVHGMQKSIS